MGYWSRFYKIYDTILNWIPTINPDEISRLMVVISLFYLFIYQFILPSIMLILILWFLDWLDGLMARRLKKSDDIIDLACDRVTEFILYSPFGIMILVVVLNTVFSVIKLKFKPNIPFIIPLKQILLVYLFWLLINDFFYISTMGLFLL